MSRAVSLLAAAAIAAAALLSLATLRVEGRGLSEHQTACAAGLCSFVIF